MANQTGSSDHPKVALCMCVKNEAFRIKEWIAYHCLLGFENIIIYDNMSTDGTSEILASVNGREKVIVVPWQRTDKRYQLDAYKDAIARFGNKYDWMGFIDSDEFVVLHNHESVSTFLREYTHASAVVINWALFGSSGHTHRPNGLLIDTFTKRSHAEERRARHVKSFVRVEAFRNTGPNPHVFDVEGATIDVLGRQPAWDEIGITANSAVYEICQINHYFLRSLCEWREKLLRGYPDQDFGVVDEGRIIAEFQSFDRNDILDQSATLLAEQTREKMRYIWSCDTA